ncbi:MAG: hypothetical protein WDZ85_01705 [Candidatus Paceibacterota bacterium]
MKLLKKKKFWFLLLIILAVLVLADDKIKSNTLNDDYWEKIRAGDVAKVATGWSTPKRLSISNDGWEEGDYISPDGKEFFFIYTTVDVFNLIYSGGSKPLVSGPVRDRDNSCTHPLKPQPHPCGQWPRADLFYSVKNGSQWSEPVPHPLTQSGPVGGFTYAGANKAYFMHAFTGDVEDIGYAVRTNGVWGPKIKVAAVSVDGYSDSDPHVNASDDEMIFWSDRPAHFSGKNLYRSVKVGNQWQTPELLAEPINGNGDSMTPFFHDGYLYYGASFGPETTFSIYRSQRLGANAWAQPEMVVTSKFAVGEPSLTANGRFLYFEQIFIDGQGRYNPDLMYIERL